MGLHINTSKPVNPPLTPPKVNGSPYLGQIDGERTVNVLTPLKGENQINEDFPWSEALEDMDRELAGPAPKPIEHKPVERLLYCAKCGTLTKHRVVLGNELICLDCEKAGPTSPPSA